MKTLLRWMLVASLAVSCRALSANDTSRAERILDEILAADHAGDVERVMACYTESPMLLPPNEAAVAGRDAIRARYIGAFTRYRFEFGGSADEAHVAGDTGWMRGETHGTLVSKSGGENLSAHDRFLAILERARDGKWRIARLMWSPLDAAPASHGTASADSESEQRR
jgi:uncharacterized protein (TIGR02246 family)